VTVAELLEIHTYPVKGEPGRDHVEALIGTEGLEGDRRKKAPVHVLASEDVPAGTRANLVVSTPARELLQSIGSRLVVGAVHLAVTGTARDCPGVYADVAVPGPVRVGDAVTTTGEGTVTTTGEPA
jgi:hypothetical protein